MIELGLAVRASPVHTYSVYQEYFETGKLYLLHRWLFVALILCLTFYSIFFFLLRMSFVVGGVKNTVGLYNPLVGAQGQLEWSKDNPVVWEGNYFV